MQRQCYTNTQQKDTDITDGCIQFCGIISDNDKNISRFETSFVATNGKNDINSLLLFRAGPPNTDYYYTVITVSRGKTNRLVCSLRSASPNTIKYTQKNHLNIGLLLSKFQAHFGNINETRKTDGNKFTRRRS